MRPLRIVLSCLVAAVSAKDLLVFQSGLSNYALASSSLAPTIWVANNDRPGVKRAAKDLAADFGRVTGKNGTAENKDSLSTTTAPLIVAGTIGQSDLVDELISKNKIDVSAVKGKWEAFTSKLVKNPTANIPWALVVAGSDHRGTIYGMYNISETIGVSPWYWWADVAPKKKTGIWVQDTQTTQKPPSVKYRGIFINDEAPALSSWAAKTFGGNPTFNSKLYAQVFELLLRLKANYLWPAMWSSGFYVDDTKNGPLANEYGIFMGTSHHEPMARSEREQKADIDGAWDWITNKEEITEFFQGGADRGSQWDTVYTLGMRGEGDSQSPTLTAEALEDVIAVQQSILSDVYNTTDLLDVPQAWVLYKVGAPFVTHARLAIAADSSYS